MHIFNLSREIIFNTRLFFITSNTSPISENLACQKARKFAHLGSSFPVCKYFFGWRCHDDKRHHFLEPVMIMTLTREIKSLVEGRDEKKHHSFKTVMILASTREKKVTDLRSWWMKSSLSEAHDDLKSSERKMSWPKKSDENIHHSF